MYRKCVRQKRRSQINNLSFHFKKLEKSKINPNQAEGRRVEINKMESEKINEIKSYLEKNKYFVRNVIKYSPNS